SSRVLALSSSIATYPLSLHDALPILHFVGAGDRYIANRFLRHFLRLGLEGGVIGGGIAMLAFGFSESIAGWFSGTPVGDQFAALDRKSTRLNSSHEWISYAVFCLKKK